VIEVEVAAPRDFVSVCRAPLFRAEADVSCVLTFYNQSDFLEEALGSLLLQQSSRESVLVDDASRLDEALIAERLCERFNIRYLREHDNVGVSVARSIGLSATGGEFVMFLDADDVLSEGYLDLLVSALKSDPSASFALGVQHFFRNHPGDSTERWPSASICRDDCWKEPCLSGSGVLFRREALLSVGGFRAAMSSRFEDWDLGLRLMLDGKCGLLVEDAVYHYRRHGSSLMDRIDPRARACVDAAFALRYRNGFATSREAMALLGRRFFPLLLGELRAGRLASAAGLLSEANRLSGCGWHALVRELPMAWSWYVNRNRLSDA
jgi:glycosyltransferase involved in cell wall biosynthesis